MIAENNKFELVSKYQPSGDPQAIIASDTRGGGEGNPTEDCTGKD